MTAIVMLAAFHTTATNATNESSFPSDETYCSTLICNNAIQKPTFVDVPEESPKLAIATVAASNTIRISEATDMVSNFEIFVWPTAVYGTTQKFTSWHKGIDISNGEKVEIYAAATGVVEFVGWQSGYGNSIIIDHGNGYKTLYAHLSKFNVIQNQSISQSHVIGWQGNTGWVRRISGNGTHLHFEVWLNNKPVNPLLYIK